MSRGDIIFNAKIYEDATASNDPSQRILDWRQHWAFSDLSQPSVQYLRVTSNTIVEVSIPGDVSKWTIIYADRALDIVASPKTGLPIPVVPGVWDYDNALGIWVEPMTVGTKDGVFFLKGYIKTLQIGVPGANNANVVVFTGY